MRLLSLGTIDLRQFKTHYHRLEHIYERVGVLINTYQPTQCAIEAPFYGKNVQSMLKLGRAQGVAIASALAHRLVVVEYSAKKIKQAITGNGNATKQQVADMLQRLFQFKDMPHYLDATDALAVAVCHFFKSSSSSPITPRSASAQWKDFFRQFPERVIR